MEVYKYRDRQNELTYLYYTDADSDGIDECGIYFDSKTKEYIILSASGCSCWDGDGWEEKFPTLQLAAESLYQGSHYNCGFKFADEIVREATKKALELKLPYIKRMPKKNEK